MDANSSKMPSCTTCDQTLLPSSFGQEVCMQTCSVIPYCQWLQIKVAVNLVSVTCFLFCLSFATSIFPLILSLILINLLNYISKCSQLIWCHDAGSRPHHPSVMFHKLLTPKSLKCFLNWFYLYKTNWLHTQRVFGKHMSQNQARNIEIPNLHWLISYVKSR